MRRILPDERAAGKLQPITACSAT